MAFDPALDISALLVSASIGTAGTTSTSTWGIFIGKEPAGNYRTITLYNTVGLDPEPLLNINYPSIQVRVRGIVNDYAAGWTKIADISKLLISHAVYSGTTATYTGFWQQGSDMFLMYDENSQPIFISSWRLAAQPTSLGNRPSP